MGQMVGLRGNSGALGRSAAAWASFRRSPSASLPIAGAARVAAPVRASRSGRLARIARGVFMVELSLALVISALAAAGAVRESVRSARLTTAKIDGDVLAIYRVALQNYVDDGYPQLQQAIAPVRNAITPANMWSPTLAELIGMGYLPAGFQVGFANVDAANLNNAITRLPVGCVSTDCSVVGLAWVDRPFVIRGTNDVDNLVVGQVLESVGTNGGTSFEDNPAQIAGVAGVWTDVNPVAGQPAGVVSARFGANSSIMATFLRMNDIRDPNFQNNVTIAGGVIAAGPSQINNTLGVTGATTLGSTLSVAGAATLNGGATINGNTTANGQITATGEVRSSSTMGASDVGACLRAGLTAGGDIVSRAANCGLRAQMTNAGLELFDAGGVMRASMNNAGALTLRNAVGAATVTLDAATGRLTTQTLNVQSVANTGAACASANDVAVDSTANGTLLVCRGGQWRRSGLAEASLGAACGTAGQLAQTASDESLVCRGGFWRLLNDRLSGMVVMDIWSGNGASNVPVPVCGIGGIPDIQASALHAGADYGGAPPRNRTEVRVTGVGPWTVDPVMVDGGGAAYSASFMGTPYNLGWTAVTYCRYPA